MYRSSRKGKEEIMGDILLYLLPIELFIAVVIIRHDTKKHIVQGNKIIDSLNKYIKREQNR